MGAGCENPDSRCDAFSHGASPRPDQSWSYSSHSKAPSLDSCRHNLSTWASIFRELISSRQRWRTGAKTFSGTTDAQKIRFTCSLCFRVDNSCVSIKFVLVASSRQIRWDSITHGCVGRLSTIEAVIRIFKTAWSFLFGSRHHDWQQHACLRRDVFEKECARNVRTL